MRQSTFIGVLAAALCLAGSGAKAENLLTAANLPTAANLLTDGDFEQPVVPVVAGFNVFTIGQTIGGPSAWTVVNPTGGIIGNIGLLNTKYRYAGYMLPAASGKQSIDLTGTTDNGAAVGVSQTVRTVPGVQYDLTFYVGNVVDPLGVLGTTSTVNVFVDGVLLMTAVNTDGDAKGRSEVWKKFSATVTASSRKTTTIAFLNGDPSGDRLCGLDAVSLVRH